MNKKDIEGGIRWYTSSVVHNVTIRLKQTNNTHHPVLYHQGLTSPYHTEYLPVSFEK